MVLVCRALLENYTLVNDKDSPVPRALVSALLSPLKAVRAAALQNTKELLADGTRGLIAKILVSKLNDMLEDGKLPSCKEKSPPEEKAELTGKMILDCITTLCSCTGEWITLLLFYISF